MKRQKWEAKHLCSNAFKSVEISFKLVCLQWIHPIKMQVRFLSETKVDYSSK